MAFPGSKTEASLRATLASDGEMAARLLYLGRRADVEGRVELASQLRGVAESLMAHAFGHLEFLEEVDTADTTTGSVEELIHRLVREADNALGDASDTARREKLEDAAEWLSLVAHARRLTASRLEGTLAAEKEAEKR